MADTTVSIGKVDREDRRLSSIRLRGLSGNGVSELRSLDRFWITLRRSRE